VRDGRSRAHGRHRAGQQAQPLSDRPKPRQSKKQRGSTGPKLAGLGVSVALLAGTGFLVNSAHGETPAPDRLVAIADAYVSSASPTQRHGWSQRLVVKKDQARSLLRYGVPEAPAGFARRASLVLTRLGTGKPSRLTVARTGGAWTEAVTYQTAPRVGSAVASVADDGVSPSVRFDVTPAITRSGQLDLVVVQTSGGTSAIFGSRESGATQTRLEISYVPAGTPTTSPTTAPTTASSPTASPTVSPRATQTSGTPTASPTPTSSTTTSQPSTSPTASPTSTSTTCTVSAILVPSCGVWWGAAANPLSGESWDEALPRFESTVGRTVDIAHYYNSSPKLFPTADMIKRAREPGKNRILLLNWKPEMGRTWAQVAAGDADVDAAIDNEADYLKSTFREKFYLAVHHEPEDEVNPQAGSGMTAQDYRAMYRHVVLRLRARGVTNAVTVMNYMGTPHWGSQPWFDSLYPGDDVVDWIAEDPYIFGDNANWWNTFASSVDRKDTYTNPSWPGFYTWSTTKHPAKPIMLGEWGVDEQTWNGMSKADVLRTVHDGLRLRPKIKAIVYWNQNEFHTVGMTRLDSSSSSLSAAHAIATSGPLARKL
jgi:hypothetical protein